MRMTPWMKSHDPIWRKGFVPALTVAAKYKEVRAATKAERLLLRERGRYVRVKVVPEGYAILTRDRKRLATVFDKQDLVNWLLGFFTNASPKLLMATVTENSSEKKTKKEKKGK